MSEKCPKCGHNPRTDHLGMKARLETAEGLLRRYAHGSEGILEINEDTDAFLKEKIVREGREMQGQKVAR